jgi:signal peptidase II
MIQKRILLLACVCFLVIGFDQWTKAWAIAHLKDMPSTQYLGGSLLLIYAENTGAWGSMGSGLSDNLRFWLLTVIPFLFLGGLCWHTVVSDEVKPHMSLAYSMVIAGGTGNLIDRAMHGYVVDFLWFGIPGGLGTNIFNVADVAIMIGFMTLIICHFTIDRKQSVS